MSSTIELPTDTSDIESHNRVRSDATGNLRSVVTRPKSRPVSRRVMQWLRRMHLYFGLFLFPWAVLYGFTGFLFNHPRVMSEQPMTSFGRDVWTGTPMEQPADLVDTARQVVRAMQARHPERGATLNLVETEPVRYTNDLAFATWKTSEEDIFLAISVFGTGGTIRRAPANKTAEAEARFPWSIDRTEPPRKDGSEKHSNATTDGLFVENALSNRLEASLPQLIQAKNLPEGDLTISSVPDLTFVVESEGERWKTRYNALKGTVVGKPLETAATLLSWRRFLTRLHLAHGYPSASQRARWFWAILVDAMAFVMMYWGGSGLLMWWQIKATRRLGMTVLVVSAAVATLLALGMYGALTAA